MRVNRFAGRVREELGKTRRDPRRVLRLSQRRYRRLLVRSFTGAAGGWQPRGGTGLQGRTYRSYDDYVRHQQSKPGEIRLTDHDDRLSASLASRLGGIAPGSSVLCLGARFGGEVRAFLEVGCFAVGLDLRTAPESKHVLFGDFHDIQFPDGCVDVVFTNSLDHTFDITLVLAEIVRVLKPSGRLIVDAVRGEAEGHPPGMWECFYWSTTDDLVELVSARGFAIMDRTRFDAPWGGEQLRFAPVAEVRAAAG